MSTENSRNSSSTLATWFLHVALTNSHFSQFTKLNPVLIIVSNWYSSLAVLWFAFAGAERGQNKKLWKIDREKLFDTFKIKYYV